jgi:hypothetical protein
MKNIVKVVILLILTSQIWANQLKPYILASETKQSMLTTKNIVREKLTTSNFEILGEYSPADDLNRHVIIITHPELLKCIQKTGGITGFSATLRVALTTYNDVVQISYTNPEYFAIAYFQNKYNNIENNISIITSELKNIFLGYGELKNIQFGSENGMTKKELQKYHYMFGMEYFEDVVVLSNHSSFDEAIKIVENNLNKKNELSEVYSIKIPQKNIKLYGVALSGETGEKHFLPIIDIGLPKHTAFLPYEILVVDEKVIMMHGRYRIALAFPDLTMMTFSKIMSTPGDIEDLMKKLTR